MSADQCEFLSSWNRSFDGLSFPVPIHTPMGRIGRGATSNQDVASLIGQTSRPRRLVNTKNSGKVDFGRVVTIPKQVPEVS